MLSSSSTKRTAENFPFLPTGVWVYKLGPACWDGCSLIKPPRERGPTLKKYLGSANARGYICNNSGAVFRQSLLVVSNCSHLLKLRIRAHLANMIKLRRRPHVEIRLRKKVTALWNSRNWPVMRDLSDHWLTTDHWLPHFSRQDSSPSFSNTSTCPILKNEAFLESLQHGQCGIAKIWDPTPLEFEIFQLSPPFSPLLAHPT